MDDNYFDEKYDYCYAEIVPPNIIQEFKTLIVSGKSNKLPHQILQLKCY